MARGTRKAFGKRVAGALGAVTLMAGVMVGIGAGTASASSYLCPLTPTPTNKSDTKYVNDYGSQPYLNIYQGPATSCATNSYNLPVNGIFYAWCNFENSSGNLWVYGVYYGSNGGAGWIYQGNLLKVSGSDPLPC